MTGEENNIFANLWIINLIPLVLVLGLLFVNSFVSNILARNPTLTIIIAIAILTGGAYISIKQQNEANKIVNNAKKSDLLSEVEKDKYINFSKGIMNQVKIHELIIVPIGVGIFVSAIFMQFSISMRERDVEHKNKANEIQYELKSIEEKSNYIESILEKNERGKLIIQLHSEILNLKKENNRKIIKFNRKYENEKSFEKVFF